MVSFATFDRYLYRLLPGSIKKKQYRTLLLFHPTVIWLVPGKVMLHNDFQITG